MLDKILDFVINPSLILNLITKPLIYGPLLLFCSCYLFYFFIGFSAPHPLHLAIYLFCGILIIPLPEVFHVLLGIKVIHRILRNGIDTADLNRIPDPFVSWEDLYSQLIPGDIIEFDRSSKYIQQETWGNLAKQYSHYGVYVSDNTVYHLVNIRGVGVILVDSLRVAANGQKCRINNLEEYAKKLGQTRLANEEIFSRARALMTKKESNYDVLQNNCEHFVTYCVYGEAFSTQGSPSYNLLFELFYKEFLNFFGIYMGIYLLFKVHWIQNSLNAFVNTQTFETLSANIQSLTDLPEQPMYLKFIYVAPFVACYFIFLLVF